MNMRTLGKGLRQLEDMAVRTEDDAVDMRVRAVRVTPWGCLEDPGGQK